MPSERDVSTPKSYFWAIGLSIVLALVPTIWTSVDFDAAGIFFGQPPAIASRQWGWVVLINEQVPALFRSALAIGSVAWIVATLNPRLIAWRLPLAFFVLGGILGPGAVVNLGFKDNWQRARPYQVEAFGGAQKFSRAGVITDQCDNNCSFVSGHVACGAFLVALSLVDRRRRALWMAVGAITGLTIGFARMSAMDHWLSDVLWAFPITLASAWVCWKPLSWLYSGKARPSHTVG
jgi:lipid A 4'-phosphatase